MSVAAIRHYTCRDGKRAIVRSGGIILPQPQPTLGGIRLAWFVDMPQTAEQMGLDRVELVCDRTTEVALVGEPDVRFLRWYEIRHNFPVVAQWALQRSGTNPARWLVATEPVAVERWL